MKRSFVAVLALLGLAYLFFYYTFWASNEFENDRFVIVSRGESFAAVADSLDARGILRSRWLFSIAGRMRKKTNRIQIGKYRFKSGMSNDDILEDLQTGATVEWISVTIPEGLDRKYQAHILRRTLGIDSARYMQLTGDSAFAAKLRVNAGTLEGYLFPSTYKFYWQTDEAFIVKTLVGDFWRFWNDTLQARTKAEKLTLPQALALASIVEGETRVDSERAIIAGVYLNRLKKKMRLQADPTIEFILPQHRVLRHEDLEIESPYNTYRNPGLPPGPINNPGKAAILAALNPKKSPYLFFVANGAGGHTFSKKFKDHEKAVGNYRKYREREEEK
jgi:UPF0755 protein